MKKGVCKFVEQNIWKYIDRELSARKVAEISSHLKECSSCKKFYEARAREATLYRLAFMGSPFGNDFYEKFEGRFVAELEECLPGEDTSEGMSFLGQFSGRRVAMAMGGMIAIVIVVFTLTLIKLKSLPVTPRNTTPGNYPGVATEGQRSRDSRGGPNHMQDDRQNTGPSLGVLVRGMSNTSSSPSSDRKEEVFQGLYEHDDYNDHVEVAELRLADGSNLVFSSKPWKIYISEKCAPEGAFYAELIEGAMEVTVTPRDRSRPFVVMTKNAEIEVIGTQFFLEVQRGTLGKSTRLEVSEGKVLVRDINTKEEQYVDSSRGMVVIPSQGKMPLDAPSTVPPQPTSPRPSVQLDDPVNLKTNDK